MIKVGELEMECIVEPKDDTTMLILRALNREVEQSYFLRRAVCSYGMSECCGCGTKSMAAEQKVKHALAIKLHKERRYKAMYKRARVDLHVL